MPLKYVSTRGRAPLADFETVLLKGYAPDGGLYVPERLPEVDWRLWKGLSYTQIVTELLNAFLEGEQIPVKELVERAYGPKNFADGKTAEIRKLTPELYLLELFHGPTWAFKDYALQLVGELLQFCLQRRNERRTILVATSGDTGSAAIESVAGKENINLIVLLPEGRISQIQRRQMTSVQAGNVKVFSVDANSDELDDILRPLFEDLQFSKQHNLGCINSINWGRILLQMAHWFYTYLTVSPNFEQKLRIAAPTGACGNITAGVIAKMLGLPIEIVACNGPNRAVYNCITDGSLVRTDVTPSLASAIDISVPYNMERILYYLSGRKSSQIDSLMTEFLSDGKCVLPDTLHKTLVGTISTSASSDDDIQHTIGRMARDSNLLVCPHTATALHYALDSTAKSDGPTVCIATASPKKFPDLYVKFNALHEDLLKDGGLRRLLTTQADTSTQLSTENRAQWEEIIKETVVEMSSRQRNCRN